ncbi:MAG: FprA family A-type flavoprotein [Prevotella sp.]|nr:FprA family A-type flavoprotein [Staphylococcus sp.]MCM1350298.1 FprA family A-type flavoprotein [Prevotella sp.]
MKKVTETIFYVGVNDHITDLFEGQYVVPNGMAYNSYVIMDEQIAVLDTVDIRFWKEWLTNVQSVLQDRIPNYLIIQHMEPDHSASLLEFLKVYPNTTVVGNAKTFKMIQQFFHIDIVNKKVVVDMESLSLGAHQLTFVAAPMVHWPEVMVTYDSLDRVLFSADAFGKFGALDIEDDWACEARRYYVGIVGKYGAQVQTLLKKAKTLDIQIICPLHGPILNDDLDEYFNLYHIWSSYQTESDGVAIFYTSVYGNTKQAAEMLENQLKQLGCPKVVVSDLARVDMAEAVEDAFLYGKIVLATPTYNASIFPFMQTFLDHLLERNFQNKIIGIIENGTWAPVAGNVIKKKLQTAKNIQVLDPVVTVISSLDDISKNAISELAHALI